MNVSVAAGFLTPGQLIERHITDLELEAEAHDAAANQLSERADRSRALAARNRAEADRFRRVQVIDPPQHLAVPSPAYADLHNDDAGGGP